MDYVISFLVGGAICGLVQILLDQTKLLPGRVMVLLVCLGVFLSFIGIYEPFTKWGKAGACVPLIGFGNTLFQGIKDAIDKEGWIGIFKGGFTSCAVGVSAALVFAYVGSFIFKPKAKV
ncbi:MAG: SpoVA/SpoVAEb family sporulation membrane protein [Lachnospiraceae bacterium]|nr:SpoVA/SpoVAEb family sporulation membrane protein [Lachnospiraceae bacterium]